ncbi:unnamed protein product, partial [Polarella glacialis]
VHHTVTLERSQASSDEVIMAATAEDGTDLLILAGAPLREPVAMGANVIMSSSAELEQAERDLTAGLFGPSFRHTEEDSTWQGLVSEHWRKVKEM